MPGKVAVIVTAVGADTASAVTGKVMEVARAGIATVAGSCTAAGELVDRVAVIPPTYACPLRVMVPVSVCPLDHV
jgi:hypothetical protein